MIEKNIYRTTCDIKNCRNTAVYTIPSKGRMGKFYICAACLSSLVAEGAKHTPKIVKGADKL